MVMKPGKRQRSKQRCQDLGWKVHDHAQSFVLRSVKSKWLLCFVHDHGQKSEQIPTTKNFVEFHNNSPLLTMVLAKVAVMMANNRQNFVTEVHLL